MTLAPGSKLGPYEIVGLIGAGGMGEVYKARDPKLGRMLAIKVLPPSLSEDTDRLRRFQQEAMVLAALNHPNLVQVFEAGEYAGSPYVAMELLEGETLRERMQGKPLAPRRGAEFARGAALGLAAAHEKGILHRDMKPENLFVTKDGRVKLLDFGLAKFDNSKPIGQESETRAFLSEPGTVVGTSGYMSPEQIRSEALDARSDLFSLGVILYEMLTGARPFQGGSSVEVMHAILKDDPPELDPELKIPPLLERVLNGCLAKEPAGRFHSAHDLAFALETLSSTGSESARFPKVRARRFGLLAPTLFGAAALLVLALGLGVLAWVRRWPPFRPPQQPTFTRLTFKQGQIRGARFSPDGREVIFDAAWDGGRPQIYSLRPDTLEARPLGIHSAALLFLTRGGDLGVALNAKNSDEFDTIGDLAKAPLGGTAPKAMLKDVVAADQAPDGQMAVVTGKDFPPRLEFPVGQKRSALAQGSTVRFSADGRQLAVLGRKVFLLDAATGKLKPLSQRYPNMSGLSWMGDEVWFCAGRLGHQLSLRAVNLKGRERVVLETPGRFRLLDVDDHGRALLAQEDFKVGILHWGPGQSAPKDLTREEHSFLFGMNREGTQVVFGGKARRAGKDVDTIFLGPVDGPPQVLNEGWYSVPSPDGRWVATIYVDKANRLVLYPTGPGQERTLATDGVTDFDSVAWTRDSKALLVSGGATGKPARVYLLPLEGGSLRPLTPEGVSNGDWGTLDPAPDGRQFLAKGPDGWAIHDLQDPERAPVPVKDLDGSFTGSSGFLGWTADSRRFYTLHTSTPPFEVHVLDPRTGLSTPFSTFRAERMPEIGILPWASRITADGKSLAVTYFRKPSTLYLVEGLK